MVENKILIFRNWEEMIKELDKYIVDNEQNYAGIKAGGKTKPLTLLMGLYATSSSYGFDGGVRLVSMEYREEFHDLESLAQGIIQKLSNLAQHYGANILPLCYTNLEERNEDDIKVDDLTHLPYHRALTASEIKRFEELFFV